MGKKNTSSPIEARAPARRGPGARESKFTFDEKTSYGRGARVNGTLLGRNTGDGRKKKKASSESCDLRAATLAGQE